MEFEQFSLDDPLNYVYDDIFAKIKDEHYLDNYIQELLVILDQDLPLIEDIELDNLCMGDDSLPNSNHPGSVQLDHNYAAQDGTDFLDDIVDMVIQNIF